MADNTITRSFAVTVDMESVSMVSDFFDSCLEEYEIPMRVGYSLKVVADEIYSNIVHYSGAKNAEVLFVNAQEQITLVFRDDGIPYNPMEADTPDVTADLEDRQIGGLGMFMVKKMCQEVAYEYADGKNQMTVILSKTPKKKKRTLEDFE